MSYSRVLDSHLQDTEHIRFGEIIIPGDDLSAYVALPKYQWLYNKLEVARSQNLEAYPHGIVPQRFPVFSKPICNLYGLSEGARILHSWDDLKDYTPGHFWMPYIEGPQYTTDLVVRKGEVLWRYSMKAHKEESSNLFRFFRGRSSPDPIYLQRIYSWIRRHLPEYTGVLNIEHIGEVIIEVHPRYVPEFLCFYGDRWIGSVLRLCCRGSWRDFSNPMESSVCLVVKAEKRGVYKFVGQGQDFSPALEVRPLLESDGSLDSASRLALINAKSLSAALAVEPTVRACFVAKEL